MRLIDADALLAEAMADGAYGYVDAKQIADAPTIDAVPVVRASWEQVEVRYEDELIDNPVQAVASMFCPKCQRYHNEVYFYGMPTERVSFCPNCGAKMDEVEE